MNVFLTGEVQVGKSTAITRFLAANPPRTLGGFRTVSRQIENGENELFIVPADFAGEPDASQLVGIRRGGHGSIGFAEVFDTVGARLLRLPEDCDLVLMDELGKMETEASVFCAAVLKILDGPVPVLGAAKRRETHSALLDAVREHPDTVVLDVTKENRDAIPQKIAEILSPASIP